MFQRHRAGPPTKNDLAPNVSSAEVDKPAPDCKFTSLWPPVLFLAPTESIA